MLGEHCETHQSAGKKLQSKKQRRKFVLLLHQCLRVFLSLSESFVGSSMVCKTDWQQTDTPRD